MSEITFDIEALYRARRHRHPPLHHHQGAHPVITPALYHWSPTQRRTAILHEGLRAGSPHSAATEPLPYISVGPDPRRAWLLSAGTGWCDATEWDLWMMHPAGIGHAAGRIEDGALVEVTIPDGVPPDRLWLVGSRSSRGTGATTDG